MITIIKFSLIYIIYVYGKSIFSKPTHLGQMVQLVVSKIFPSMCDGPREWIDPWQIIFWSLLTLQNWTGISNPVAFDVLTQAIKITKWQITNAIIQHVDLRISPFLIDCFLLFSFELRAEQSTTTHNWND